MVKKIFIVFLMVFALSFAFACNETNDDKQNQTVEYTVTFVVDGEKTEVKVKDGEKAAKPADPEKVGYTFSGWYVGEAEYDFEDPVTADTTVTAKFEEVIVEYTVKFVANGEETVQTVKEGEKAVKPSDPVKEGYKFIGWYTGEEIYDFEKVVISDLELVASFEKISRYDLIKEKGVIVITTSPDFAPYEFIDGTKTDQDRYVGCDIELMKYIAEKLGVKLEIIATDFDTTYSLIQNGNADLGIAAYIYDEKKVEQFELSKPYDEEGKQGVIVLKEKVEEYKDLASINKNGNSVAATSNTYQAEYASQFLNNVELRLVDDIENGLSLLDKGYVVAVAASSTAAEKIIAENGDKYVFLDDTFPVSETETQMIVLAQKGEEELIAEVNKIIDEVIEKGLYKKWIKEAKELAEELGEL